MISNLLTSSRLKTARGCKREHRIKYELGYRPATEAEELFFGSLIHLGLEAWWNAVKDGTWVADGLPRALAAMRAVKCDPFVQVRAETMMMGYDARWSADAANYEVLGVEQRFECDVVNPETGAPSRTWRLGGKLDVLVRDRRDGLVRFIEHKTSSEDVSPGSPYWRKLRMDGQVSVYFDGSAALGHEATACIYDVLGKPGLRPLKATPLEKRKYKADGTLYANLRDVDETPEEYRLRVAEAITSEPDRYYSRGEVVRLEQELADARFDVWAMGRELRENELAGRAQRNPDACFRMGNWCPFFDVCTGAASLDDQALFRKSDNVHSELQPEHAGSTSSDSEQSPKEVGT